MKCPHGHAVYTLSYEYHGKRVASDYSYCRSCAKPYLIRVLSHGRGSDP